MSKASPRLQAIAAKSPEFGPWLAVVEIALEEASAPAWSEVDAQEAPARGPDAPLLCGARIVVPEGAARRLLGRLLEKAAPLRAAARSSRLEPLGLLEAAIDHDAARLAQIAEELGAPPASLGPIAQLAAMPLLLACRRALGPRVPASFCEGFCPVCGAWPTMAEVRGLERQRRLRCGRCGADWGVPTLSCPFCGQRDHARLVSLVPEAGGEARRVEACEACHGYLKTLASLAAWPGEAVLLEDLATVDLDLAALERGHARPEDPGRPVGVRLSPSPEKKRSRWGLFS